jgi:hypothetical protein
MRRIFISSLSIILIVLISYKSFGQLADILVPQGGFSSEYVCSNSHVLAPTFINFTRLLFSKQNSYDKIMGNFGYTFSDQNSATAGYSDSCGYLIQRNTAKAYTDKSGHSKIAQTSLTICYAKNDGYLNSILYDMRSILLNKISPSVDDCGVQTYYLNIKYLNTPTSKVIVEYSKEKIIFLLE